jgi:hypothetical protein
VANELVVLGLEHLAQPVERSGAGPGAPPLGNLDDAEQLEATFRRACPELAKTPVDAVERLLRAVDELGLDLGEGLDDRLAIEDGDLVEGDLDAVDTAPVAARPQCRDRLQLAIVQDSGERPRDRARRSRRPAGLLELDPCVGDWDLQLPDARTVLGAPPKRDPGPEEPAIGRVVIRRGEDVRLERPASEPIELDPVRLELDLALEGPLYRVLRLTSMRLA